MESVRPAPLNRFDLKPAVYSRPSRIRREDGSSSIPITNWTTRTEIHEGLSRYIIVFVSTRNGKTRTSHLHSRFPSGGVHNPRKYVLRARFLSPMRDLQFKRSTSNRLHPTLAKQSFHRLCTKQSTI